MPLNVPSVNNRLTHIFYTPTYQQNCSKFVPLNIMLISSNLIDNFDIFYDDSAKLKLLLNTK